MTGFTGLIQPQIGVSSLPQFDIADVIGLVTSPAIRAGMHAHQLKFRLRMIKPGLRLPTLGRMTTGAVLLRIVPRTNRSTVNIVMTINASLSKAPELPLVILQMTSYTRRCHMRTCQRKCRGSMLLHTEGARGKTCLRMTGSTVRHLLPDGKLPFMVIRMATGTSRVRHRLRVAFRRMALPTIHPLMLTQQREIGQGVVKSRRLNMMK